ncbi:MAG: hypothetical protein LBI20_01000 [Holosporales bacterium]|jgi:hypothetical protein|nr:hypothetical protein [Holosporales bacterium]
MSVLDRRGAERQQILAEATDLDDKGWLGGDEIVAAVSSLEEAGRLLRGREDLEAWGFSELVSRAELPLTVLARLIPQLSESSVVRLRGAPEGDRLLSTWQDFTEGLQEQVREAIEATKELEQIALRAELGRTKASLQAQAPRLRSIVGAALSRVVPVWRLIEEIAEKGKWGYGELREKFARWVPNFRGTYLTKRALLERAASLQAECGRMEAEFRVLQEQIASGGQGIEPAGVVPSRFPRIQARLLSQIQEFLARLDTQERAARNMDKWQGGNRTFRGRFGAGVGRRIELTKKALEQAYKGTLLAGEGVRAEQVPDLLEEAKLRLRELEEVFAHLRRRMEYLPEGPSLSNDQEWEDLLRVHDLWARKERGLETMAEIAEQVHSKIGESLGDDRMSGWQWVVVGFESPLLAFKKVLESFQDDQMQQELEGRVPKEDFTKRVRVAERGAAKLDQLEQDLRKFIQSEHKRRRGQGKLSTDLRERLRNVMERAKSWEQSLRKMNDLMHQPGQGRAQGAGDGEDFVVSPEAETALMNELAKLQAENQKLLKQIEIELAESQEEKQKRIMEIENDSLCIARLELELVRQRIIAQLTEEIMDIRCKEDPEEELYDRAGRISADMEELLSRVPSGSTESSSLPWSEYVTLVEGPLRVVIEIQKGLRGLREYLADKEGALTADEENFRSLLAEDSPERDTVAWVERRLQTALENWSDVSEELRIELSGEDSRYMQWVSDRALALNRLQKISREKKAEEIQKNRLETMESFMKTYDFHERFGTSLMDQVAERAIRIVLSLKDILAGLPQQEPDSELGGMELTEYVGLEVALKQLAITTDMVANLHEWSRSSFREIRKSRQKDRSAEEDTVTDPAILEMGSWPFTSERYKYLGSGAKDKALLTAYAAQSFQESLEDWQKRGGPFVIPIDEYLRKGISEGIATAQAINAIVEYTSQNAEFGEVLEYAESIAPKLEEITATIESIQVPSDGEDEEEEEGEAAGAGKKA